MIRSFRHKGLKLLYETGSRRGLRPDQTERVARILARLDQAEAPTDMNLPGWRLHPLKADLAGLWAVSVSGNWRITFRLDAGDAYDVDLIDYH